MLCLMRRPQTSRYASSRRGEQRASNCDILLGADTVDFRMTTFVGGSYANESYEPRDDLKHCRGRRVFCFEATELKTMTGG